MKKQKNKTDKMSDAYRKIAVTKDGPYIVSGWIPLAEQIITNDKDGFSFEWREGVKYPLLARYSLCRCGQSKTLPFCDGIHTHTGFDGTETADRKPYCEKADRINGPSLTLTDYLDLCASARFCDRAGGIWKLTRQSDKKKSRFLAISEGGNCPSGRLVIWDKQSHEPSEPAFEPSVGLIEYPEKAGKGPIWVRGRIPVESADGTLYEIRNRVTLCRCGRSENKPFCDSSHLELMSE